MKKLLPALVAVSLATIGFAEETNTQSMDFHGTSQSSPSEAETFIEQLRQTRIGKYDQAESSP